MSQDGDAPYAFAESLPLAPIRPGRTVLVSGDGFSAAADVARSMVADGTAKDEGALFISTNDTYTTVLRDCRRLCPALDDTRLGIIDCTGQDVEQADLAASVSHVSTQSDLTGIGMQYSALYEELYAAAAGGRVRTGLDSLSSLAMYVDLRTLFRFAHTVSARVDSAGGLGALVIDPSAQDATSVSTLSQVADGIIEVRDPEGGGSAHDSELRVRGLPDQPRDWTGFSLSTDGE